MMRKAALLTIVLVLLSSCRRDTKGYEDPTPPAPSKLRLEAVNEGADLKLTWTPSEGAEKYRVYCNGFLRWEGKDTTHTLRGEDGVCDSVSVTALRGTNESWHTTRHLIPWYAALWMESDGISSTPWVRIDFRIPSARKVSDADIDISRPKTGYFLLCDEASYRCGGMEVRDVSSATGLGTADVEFAFSPRGSFDYLAPPTGNYRTVESLDVIPGYSYSLFFWADLTSDGYGSMDSNDYFGILYFSSFRYENSERTTYSTYLEIYIQNNVKGLRWVTPYWF